MNRFIKPNTRHTLAALAALAFSATVPTHAAGHESPEKPFQMAVIVDDAHGRTVASGKYDAAIEKITAGKRKLGDVFSGYVNLCVAYAKAREVKKALDACDAAVAYMSEQESRASGSKNKRNPELRVYRSNLAVALSNRGVLLAATGDIELARKDFVAAMGFDTRYSKLAAGNLDRLEEIAAPDA